MDKKIVGMHRLEEKIVMVPCIWIGERGGAGMETDPNMQVMGVPSDSF